MSDNLIIRMREAQASHYKQLSCKMAGRYDHEMGLKEKFTGWGVVSKSRTNKGISRRDRVRTGHGKRGGKK